MRLFNALLGLGLVAAVTGCGSDEGNDDNGSAPVPSTTGDPPGTGDEFSELMAYDWTVDPGVEAYYCGYQTLTEDLYISRFRPLVPTGTHHVVIGYQEPAAQDGFVQGELGMGAPLAEVCTGVTFGDVFAYAGTVGSEELPMPEGVAVKIPAGQQLVFGLHVMNTGTDPLGGHSGVEIVRVEASEVQNEAEVIAVTNPALMVPPGESTQPATCTLTDNATIFAVMPHMHLMGVHMTTTAGPAEGESVTLLDTPYEFTDQRYTLLDPPVELQQGDTINVACSYENTSADIMTQGESTDGNEMCVTFAYRYPAVSVNEAVDTTPGFPVPRGYCVF
jgi:hypothetical protein